MADTKATERIKSKNRKKGPRKKKKAPEGASEASEKASEKPTGPEPKGMKERVKKGFLAEREALRLLADSPEVASSTMVGWLRNRLKHGRKAS